MNEKTLPRLFLSRVDRYKDRRALVRKVEGRWEPVSWNQYAAKVRDIFLGLLSLGIRKGDAVAILSWNRVEWVFADMAILSTGGICVPIYASNLPRDVAYVIEHSDSRFAFVEDREQLAKILEVRSDLPGLETIVVFEGDGDPEKGVLSLDELMDRGRNVENADDVFREHAEAVVPEDLFTYSYTSGTTGPPKGAMLTHANIRFVSERSIRLIDFRDSQCTLSFLPLAHLLERFVFYTSMEAGLTVYFAESIEKIPENLLEVRPHGLISVPRLYEKIYTRVLNQAEAGSPITRKIFHWASGIGRTYARLHSESKPIPTALLLQYRIADLLVFRKLRARFGGRIFFLGTGGAPISSEISEFLYAAGMPPTEAYGLTETSAPSTMSHTGQFRLGTVGKPLEDVEVKIAEDGEILIRGGNVFVGYLKNPEATAEAMKDGWFHSGDVGELDEDGFLRITDRKKDLIITAGGKNIAPQNIENLIKTDRFISQVMVYGDRMPYCVALITLDPEEMRRWATEQGIDFLSPGELVENPEVVKLVRGIVDSKNQQLPRFEQIKKFRVLPEDFSQDTGELTPTLKVKRKFTSQKYWNLIEEMYKEDSKE